MRDGGGSLAEKLNRGEFVVTAELGPPKSADIAVIEKKAALLKGVVDAVNVTDNQTAIVRMSSIAVSALLLKMGLEPIMQMTCRDRNRIAIQSDLLGAWALGIRNVLALSGDHQSFGNHPGSKNVYDIDSIQLVKAMRDMREKGTFINGEEVRNGKKEEVVSPAFCIGAAANPFADPFEYRVLRLEKKVAAGADFIQTQCIFDLERYRRWLEMVNERGLAGKTALLAGVMPVKSYKALEYMKKNVAGMSIPDELIERMRQAEDPKTEGMTICAEIIAELRSLGSLAGIHIMAVEWEEAVPSVLKLAGMAS